MMFARKRGLLEAFKLVRKMSVESLNLLDEMQELRLFNNAEDSEFFFLLYFIVGLNFTMRRIIKT